MINEMLPLSVRHRSCEPVNDPLVTYSGLDHSLNPILLPIAAPRYFCDARDEADLLRLLGKTRADGLDEIDVD